MDITRDSVGCNGVKTPYPVRHGDVAWKCKMNPTSLRAYWEHLRSFALGGRTTRGTLRALIREDESAVGYERNDIRAKAKEWLIAHGSSLTAEDVILARDHFGYLLPMEWGGG